MTIALTNFVQKNSSAYSALTHRFLPYGQERPVSDVATSAACMPLVRPQMAYETALADSYLCRETAGPFRRPSLLAPVLTHLHMLSSFVFEICLHRRWNLPFCMFTSFAMVSWFICVLRVALKARAT
ncbi:hypothetical protein AVEN_109285-1 [Araneus ventricosus]|uniref:Uncharacterized protein n=1 Tax=Araneus ventricosus TaxID=182803 RepID=A0A4Y2D302_ARAVE|nr:hypothetical protein AVEN_109285-1 [Araneus ventricosus]